MFRLKLLKISRQLLFHLLAQLTLSLGEWKELRFEIRIITTKVLSSSSNFVNSNVSKLPVKKVTQILYIYGTMAEETPVVTRDRSISLKEFLFLYFIAVYFAARSDILAQGSNILQENTHR